MKTRVKRRVTMRVKRRVKLAWIFAPSLFSTVIEPEGNFFTQVWHPGVESESMGWDGWHGMGWEWIVRASSWDGCWLACRPALVSAGHWQSRVIDPKGICFHASVAPRDGVRIHGMGWMAWHVMGMDSKG